MNIFKNYTFTWWQAGIFKVSVICIGVAIGANWPEVFAKHTTLLIVIAVVLGIYIGAISFKK
jgi:hypothetical protein